MSIRFKPEVRIISLSAHLDAVLALAALWSLRSRVDVEVNSIDDGPALHMVGTLHGLSLAIDLDTVGDRAADTRELAEYLRRALDPQFDIVFEGDHVHVEWDAHRPPLRGKVTT